MADESTSGVPYSQQVPYLRKISTLPTVESEFSINLSDVIILVQSTTTKKVTMEKLSKYIIDHIDAPDAYTLAKRNGFTGTLREWLDSLKGDGVNTEELGWVVGKHQVITGQMFFDDNQHPITFERDGELPIEEDAFLIYRDTETGKLYTKVNDNAPFYDEWEGLLNPFVYINEVIGDPEKTPTYQTHMESSMSFVYVTDPNTGMDYDYLGGVTDSNNVKVYENTNPAFGEMVRFTYVDDAYGKLMYYDGNHFRDYTGVIDYVRSIINNMNKITAGSASRLDTPRNIDIATSIRDDSITDIDSIDFDGTEDKTLVINALNGGILHGTAPSDFNTEGNAATATRLQSTKTISFDGAFQASVTTDMGSNVNITVNEIDASKVKGDLSVSSLNYSSSAKIGAVSGIASDNATIINDANFNGTDPARMTIKKLSAKLIADDDYVPKATDSVKSEKINHKIVIEPSGAIAGDGLITPEGVVGSNLEENDGSGSDLYTRLKFKVSSIDASFLTGTIPSTVTIPGAGTAEISETSNKVKVTSTSSKMYFVGVTSSPTNMNDTDAKLYSRDSVYADTAGTLTANNVHSVGRAYTDFSGQGVSFRNINYGASSTPSGLTLDGDIWIDISS